MFNAKEVNYISKNFNVLTQKVEAAIMEAAMQGKTEVDYVYYYHSPEDIKMANMIVDNLEKLGFKVEFNSADYRIYIDWAE